MVTKVEIQKTQNKMKIELYSRDKNFIQLRKVGEEDIGNDRGTRDEWNIIQDKSQDQS